MQSTNSTLTQKADLSGWNWGGFLLTWIWGLGNRSLVGLTLFLVVIGIGSLKTIIINYVSWLDRPWVMDCLTYLMFIYIGIMHIVHGWYGNRWAWSDGRGQTLVQFKRKQRIWTIIGFVVWLLLLLGMFMSVRWLDNNEIYQQSLLITKNDPILQTYIGKPITVSPWSLRGGVSQKAEHGIAYYKFTAKGQWQTAAIVVEAIKQNGEWVLKQQIALVPNMGANKGNSQLLLYGQKGYINYRS